MALARELVAGLDRLASLPSQYYRVREALEDPELSVSYLAELIEKDPALAASLLRLANSAFYGYPQRIETLTRAISLIGIEQVGDLVLSSAFTNAFVGLRPQRMNMERFWRGSVRRALLCRIGIQQQAVQQARLERAFVLGLLSDAGHLVLYHAMPDLMDIVLEKSAATLSEQAENERHIVGCDFAEVGAALAASWRLPPVFVEAIGAQLNPPSATTYAFESAWLNIAAVLSDAMEKDAVFLETLSIRPDVLALAGLDEDHLPQLLKQTEAEMNGMLDTFALHIH